MRELPRKHARMRFPTRWSAGAKVWSDVVERASFPGLDDECELPTRVIPPVIHQFNHVALLSGSALPLPGVTDGLPPADEGEHFVATEPPFGPALSAWGPQRWTRRSWDLDKPLWGCQVTIEQAWEPLGLTIGEPVGAIALAPGEEIDIKIFSWQRTSTSHDLETTDLVDRQVSTQLTTHDSHQVVDRVERTFNWKLSGNLARNVGAAAGRSWSIGGEVSGSTVRFLEKQFQHTRDLTKHVAEQIRSERKVKVSTSEEVGREETRQRRVTNRNPCHSVTYQFYEQLSHYKVRHAPSELTYVIVMPNPLPDVTVDWVSCHEGILRDNLLDSTMLDGFDSARLLCLESGDSPVAKAVKRLAGQLHKRGSVPAGSVKVQFAIDGTIALLLGPASAFKRIVQFITGGGGSGLRPDILDVLGKEPSIEALRGFFAALAANPSVIGLTAGVVLAARYYQKSEVAESVADALGFAVSVLASEGVRGDTPAKADAEDVEIDDAGGSGGSGEAARRRALANFARLRCHIEDNLLHYMRAIWLAEDPAKRHARFAAATIAGQAFWDLAENQLLGFHLNASIFPVRLGAELEDALADLIKVDELMSIPDLPAPAGVAGVLSTLPSEVKRWKTAVHLAGASVQRDRGASPRLLEQAMERASLKARAAMLDHADGPEREFKEAETTLKLAPGELEHLRRVGSLTPSEAALVAHADKVARTYEHPHVAADALQAHLKGLVTIGRWIKTAPSVEDFIASLPTAGVRVEAMVGHCSGCSDTAEREIEARTKTLELEVERQQKRLDANALTLDPPAPVGLNVNLTKPPTP